MLSATAAILIAFMVICACQGETAVTNCLTCSWSSGTNSDVDCFDPSQYESTTNTSCNLAPSLNPYCQTTFSLVDGIVTDIDRKCNWGGGDIDYSSGDLVPSSEKCVTSYGLYGDDVETTTCYFSCNSSDNCNTVAPQKIISCDVNCGPNGECDYITGTCACRDGFSGPTCLIGQPPPIDIFLSCHQCDDESGNCAMSNKPTKCQSSDQKYCSVSRTTTFDENGKSIRNVITRSCTTDYVAGDECFISSRGGDDILQGVEYTCISTCDSDGCNAGTPDGYLQENDPDRPLSCVVCSLNDDPSCDTSTTTSFCPSSSTHCQSIVTYYKSDKADLSYNADPDYMLISVERSCATSPLTTQCTTSSVGSSSLDKVTCQESCQGVGCNTGWPARPDCSQCSCTSCISNHPCLFSPPVATACNFPYHEFCTLQDINRAVSGTISSVEGYPRSIKRECSYKDIGDTCQVSSQGSTESCNKTCSVDGCNLGDVNGVASKTLWHPFVLTAIASLVCLCRH